jgi:hypothetical protein
MVRSILALVAVLSVASASRAATVLTTPLVVYNNGQIASCWVTNLDTRPATISVKLISQFGFDDTPPVGSGCPATLPPGQSCSSEPVYPDYCYCSVTSSTSKIRAAMLLFDGVTNQLDVEVPATR